MAMPATPYWLAPLADDQDRQRVNSVAPGSFFLHLNLNQATPPFQHHPGARTVIIGSFSQRVHIHRNHTGNPSSVP